MKLSTTKSDRLSSRKFIISGSVLVVASVFCILGFIDQSSWVTAALGVLTAYVAGNLVDTVVKNDDSRKKTSPAYDPSSSNCIAGSTDVQDVSQQVRSSIDPGDAGRTRRNPDHKSSASSYVSPSEERAASKYFGIARRNAGARKVWSG
jgi:hypothetical protein